MKLDDSQPIYRQLADEIRQQIITGRLAEGEQVMSTTQYAQALRINPATVVKAFAELTQDGLIYRQRGIGMFVSEGAREQLQSAGRNGFFKAVLQPALEEGRRIGMDDEAVKRFVSDYLKEGSGQ